MLTRKLDSFEIVGWSVVTILALFFGALLIPAVILAWRAALAPCVCP